MSNKTNLPHSQSQLTNSVIMVRPVDFGFNEQTGSDNEFQNKPSRSMQAEIKAQANKEFEQMVEKLNRFDLKTLILGKAETQTLLPDAVFPNNWFSTRADGKIFIYPMKTPNRQAEVQDDALKVELDQAGYWVDEVIDLRAFFEPNEVLEGTGSLIFDHPNNTFYAAISERCQLNAVTKFSNAFGYTPVAFNSQSTNGMPIYHTNVLMSCGEDFALIADETIIDKTEHKSVLDHLNARFSTVIRISQSQMSNAFCGNILQLKNNDDQPVIVMSAAARKGFEPAQLKQLEKHGEIIDCDIKTIEHVGGGSARCMLAENFLPLKE